MPSAGAPAELLEPGRVLASRYRADLLLGRGGMGEVWRCHDLEQGRPVAVKVVRAEWTEEPWSARLFQSEVFAMARLAHPGVVPIHDFAEEPGIGSYFVMEFRPGGSLLPLVKVPPPWPVLRALLDDLLDALAYAHSKRVLHLDIKPDNILLTRLPGGGARPTLVDFGIARVRRPGQGIERWAEGVVLGTVAYMAPEQGSGEIGLLGRWTDLYAVGAMIYEIVAGAVPFNGVDAADAFMQRLVRPAPPLVPREGYAVPVTVAWDRNGGAYSGASNIRAVVTILTNRERLVEKGVDVKV